MRRSSTITSLLLLLLLPVLLLAQQSPEGSWLMERAPQHSFIQNKGQFKVRNADFNAAAVQYGYDGRLADFFFTKNQVILELTERKLLEKLEEEQELRIQRAKEGFESLEELKRFEEEEQRTEVHTDDLMLEWLGTNPNVQIVMEDKDDAYHSYSFYNNEGTVKNESDIPSYRKLTYKNLYNKIDVVYEIHPQSGFKYSIIVHPGGDLSQVKLQYSKDIVLNTDGTITTKTDLGNIIDHAPKTFYQNQTQHEIPSAYQVNGNVISFQVGNYDRNKTLIVDPWTQIPNFINTGWDCVWECERDAAGNVYVIGGTSPLQLLKYNAGGALQWTYNTPYDTTMWLGTFAVDQAGNSYVSNGSTARMLKVTTAGAQDWYNANPGGLFSSTEFWNITFNCDETRLVVAGTGGVLPPLPYIYDIDMTTGNVISSVQVSASSLFNVQEVRSITPCNNAKYYFLTHDSIGYIHQNLTTCASTVDDIFHVSNGIDFGYKCENWRYNNSGIMAIAHYDGFIYVHRGDQLQKRDFATANVIATAPIPNGVFNTGFGGANVRNSGIDIDDCGNIFVGSRNGVHQFDVNLTLVNSYATSSNFNVYDVEVSAAGDIIAGGSTGDENSGARTGYIQSFAVSACAPQTIICCDATVCNNDFCINSAPAPMEITTPGGTFTASCGTCIDAVTGVFDPSVAGVGQHVVTYTIACGADSASVVVNSCSAMNVCEELNGSYTVSGGSFPYNWYIWNPGSTTPITNQTECEDCGFTWNTGGFFPGCRNGLAAVSDCVVPAGWELVGTGTNQSAPATYPLIVVDGGGDTVSISGPGVMPACGPLLPVELLSFDAFLLDDKTVQTLWSTAQEDNIAFFEVQHSPDGVNWEAIGRLPSQGNSKGTQVYELLDPKPYSGATYYRLRQVEESSQFSFSEIVHVQMGDDPSAIQLFPNPTKGAITLTLANTEEAVTIQLFDALGRELPLDYSQKEAMLQLNLKALSAGHYILKIQQGNHTYLRKVEKI